MPDYRAPSKIRLETSWENGVELDVTVVIPPGFEAEDTAGIFVLLSDIEQRVGEIRLVPQREKVAS